MSQLDIRRVKIDPALAMRVPAHLAMRRQILPYASLNGRVHAACADLTDIEAIEAVERFTGLPVVAQVAEPEALRQAIRRIYAMLPRERARDEGAQLDPEDAVRLSAQILSSAALRQASDIHLEPTPDGLTIRLRVDGMLEDFRHLPVASRSALLSRFKVLAGMDIAEKRAPQDGSMKYRLGDDAAAPTLDIRAATLPTKYGERMTLRLLGLGADSLSLEHLGLMPRDLLLAKQLLKQPHGLALLTGPTGSGKTTTLYAFIRYLLEQEPLNIITIEDPIECEIPGVSQVEVETGDKVSFTNALRSVLRHDPDVVMIGEIRDAQTLDVAIKASLTGHLVLSTLHTNSASGAVTRMVDMGAPPYLIAATLRLAAAQRLVRRLCQSEGCRHTRPLTQAEAMALGDGALAGATAYEPGGCAYCGGRGYHGRVGVFELLPLQPSVVEKIIARGEDSDRLNAAQGLPMLRDDARAKVLAGLISPTEALEIVEAVL